jgi:hypothetical protein
VGANITSYTATDLNPDTQYCYYVTAFNDAGESTWSSNEACATTLPISESPDPPSGLTVSNTTQDSITLMWQDNSNNENGFKIYRWNGTEFQYWTSVGTNITTFTDTGLDCGSGYAYEVSAYNSDGESAHTAWVEGTTESCGEPPATPSNLQAAALDSTRIKLTWTDNSDNEDGFHIYSEDYVATVGSNTTSYIVTDLEPDTWYCHHIFAYNDAGTSAWTDWACDTTLFSYYEDFSDSSSGWPTISNSIYRADYSGGEYEIEVLTADRRPWATGVTVGNRNYKLEADMRLYDGSPIRYGFVFDVQDASHFYVFSVNPTGQNWALEQVSNSWTTVREGTSSYINADNATNHLEVQKYDQMLQLSVNGHMLDLCTTCGGAFSGDLSVGVYAKSGGAVPVTARYDDFSIEELR